MKESRGERIFHIVNAVLLILFSLFCLYPMYYVLMASFSNSGSLLAHSGLLFAPLKPNVSAYALVLRNGNIWSGYGNTLFIVGVGTVLSLLVTSAAGYALSRPKFRAGRVIMILVTFTMMFSGGMIPLFIIVRSVGLYDTIWSLIIPVLVNTTNLIILRTAFSQVPESLVESAKLDGASEWTIMFRIIVPLSKATIAVILLYYAVGIWNSWFPAMIYLKGRDKYPLQLILREILLLNDTGVMTTSADAVKNVQLERKLVKYCTIIVSTLPIMCFYPFIQKYFTKGVMIGAVKG